MNFGGAFVKSLIIVSSKSIWQCGRNGFSAGVAALSLLRLLLLQESVSGTCLSRKREIRNSHTYTPRAQRGSGGPKKARSWPDRTVWKKFAGNQRGCEKSRQNDHAHLFFPLWWKSVWEFSVWKSMRLPLHFLCCPHFFCAQLCWVTKVCTACN